MNWIVFDKSELENDNLLLCDERADHIISVLKLSCGDKVRVNCINGLKGSATISSINGRNVNLKCELKKKSKRSTIDLVIAMPRPKVMKRLWAQIAAIGVNRVFIISSQRVEQSYFDSHVLKFDNYHRLLLEGLSQSGESHIPEVKIYNKFSSFFDDVANINYSNHFKMIANPFTKLTIYDKSKLIEEFGKILIAVGPEGGWIQSEMDLFIKNKFEQVTLGKRVLRSDTAVIGLLNLIRCILDSDNNLI